MTSPPPVLDPFVLPFETDGRFRMMMVAAAILAWSLGAHLIAVPNLMLAMFQLSPELQRLVDHEYSKALERGTIVISPQTAAELQNHLPELRRLAALAVRQLWRAGVSLLLVLALLVSTSSVYGLLPFYLRRRYRAVPLDGRLAPKVVAELAELAERAGLPRVPQLWVKPGFLDGLAFRGFRRQALMLAGEPSVLERSWSDLHRAVALHELGHLANRDVAYREVARSLWLGMAGVVLTTSALLLPGTSLRALARFGWQTLGVLVLMWALWGGLVRAREVYADWRVVIWGYGEALRRRLSLPSSWEKGSPGGGPLHRFRRVAWWLFGRTHPSNRERAQVLDNPASLFRVSAGLACQTGVLLGVLAGTAGPLLLDSVVAFQFAIGMIVVVARFPVAVFLLFSLQIALSLGFLLVAGRWTSQALGVQLQRAALFDLAVVAARWRYLELAPTAGLFVLGLEGGLQLSPAALLGWQDPGGVALWLMGFSLLVWIWLAQTRGLARMVLGAGRSKNSVRRASRALGWISSFQLAVLLGPALVGRFALFVATQPELAEALRRSPEDPIAPLTFFRASAFVFLAAGLLVSALTGIAAFVITAGWLWRRSTACDVCGEAAAAWRLVGVECRRCGEPLAPWFIHRPEAPRVLGERR